MACLAGLAATGFVAEAQAAPQTFVALDFEVAPDAGGCPDAEEFGASVGRQLGYDPFRPEADKRVAVQIARKDGGFDGRIRWSDANRRWAGDRHLSSRRPDCREIAASLAFSVAVQIQLLAALAPPAREEPSPSSAGASVASVLGSNAPTAPRVDVAAVPAAGALVVTEAPAHGASQAPSAQPAGKPTLPPEEPARAVPAGRLELWAGGGPSLALAMAPGPAGSGRIFVSGRLAQLSLELSVDAALPAEQRRGDGSGFSLYWFAAGAAACGHAWALAACVTSRLGRIEAHGFGVDAPASPSGGLYQVGARLAATGQLGRRYFIAIRAEALVSLSSWTIMLNDAAVWMTPRVGALAGVDLGARLF